MRSHEARIAEAVASLTHRLEGWGVDDAATKAHEFVRDMLHNGWRTTTAALDLPADVRPAARETAEQALTACRSALAAHRSDEQPDRGAFRHHDETSAHRGETEGTR